MRSGRSPSTSLPRGASRWRSVSPAWARAGAWCVLTPSRSQDARWGWSRTGSTGGPPKSAAGLCTGGRRTRSLRTVRGTRAATRTAGAVPPPWGTPWGLVFVASSLRPLTGLPAVPDRTNGLIHTSGDAWRQQGRALLQRRLGCVHAPWSQGTTGDHGFARLFATQQRRVPG